MTLPRTTADVLSEHVVFEAESVDRMYLNVYQPKLQDDGGVSAFFVSHRGHKYASSVLMAPITEAFVVSRRRLTQLLRCSRPARLGGLRPAWASTSTRVRCGTCGSTAPGDRPRKRGRRHASVEIMADGAVAADGVQIPVWSGGQQWLVSWHPPPEPPDGTPHGAEGVCVTADGDIVVISPDGTIWDLPAGRPEPGESWEQTLRREMDEEACATVIRARLLGFTRGQCGTGPERGLILVRSVWRADVELRPWQARFEIADRRVVAPAAVEDALSLGSQPFAPFIRRELQEAAA